MRISGSGCKRRTERITAISTRYNIPQMCGKIKETMEQFFCGALNGTQFQSIDHVKTVISWYKERSQYNGEKSDDNHFLVSTLVNKTIEKLLEKAEPYYEGTIIKQMGIKTQFKNGTVETDFNIGFIPIEPYVVFDKIVDGKKMYSIKFQFRLNTNTYIEKFRIENHDGRKSIKIEKMGINLELFLQSVQYNGFSIDTSLKLKGKEADITDISLPL